MKNIKAIIFDAYGTLFDVNSAAEKCKDKIGDKWERFANFWRTTQLEYTWLRSLMDRHKNFWQVTEDSLDKSMKVFDIDPSMRNELLNLYKILSPYREVPGTLKALKEKKFKLAILSNGTPSLLDQLVKSNHLDNLFDDIFSIEQVGIYKPSSRVYDLPIKKYNINKSEVAFLSANTWDVSGGGNYGYQSSRVRNQVKEENMATVTNWIDHLNKPADQVAGAIYPGAGSSEGLLVILAIIIWVGWHVLTSKSESDELERLARKRHGPNDHKSNITDW